MTEGVAPPGAQSVPAAAADRRGQCHRQCGGDAGRHQVGEVVDAGAGPAEAVVARTAVADHRVEGVDGPVADQPGDTERRAPEQGSDDGVGGVLRERFHHRTAHPTGVEAAWVATDQVRHLFARRREVATLQLGSDGLALAHE